MFFFFPRPPQYLVGDRPPWAEPAPFPICFTDEALVQTLDTVGSRPAETGAKGFGPLHKMGFELVEFDARGSEAASGSVYAPDTAWGDARCHYWLNQPDDALKLWSGDIHSHPGQMGVPSPQSGQGLGDLGYAAEVFAQNEAPQYFLMPILTQTGGNGPVVIHPWVVSRDDPYRPLWAPVEICPPEQFPERVFNPAWEARVSPPHVNVLWLAKLAGAHVRDTQTAHDAIRILLEMASVLLQVVVPCGFPRVTPQVLIHREEGFVPVTFHWRDDAQGQAPEQRLASLCRYVVAVATGRS